MIVILLSFWPRVVLAVVGVGDGVDSVVTIGSLVEATVVEFWPGPDGVDSVAPNEILVVDFVEPDVVVVINSVESVDGSGLDFVVDRFSVLQSPE